MPDALTLLRDAEAKLTARANKLRIQLEAVELELNEVSTALKVMTRYGLSPELVVETPLPPEGAAPRKADVVYSQIPDTREQGLTPREIYDAIMANTPWPVSADNVRTILSRMVSRSMIRTHNGRYWRHGDVVHSGDPEPQLVSAEEAFGGPAPELPPGGSREPPRDEIEDLL